MKLVVAYIDAVALEPIREELLSLGFLSISAWNASGSVPEPTTKATYRGTAIEQHLRPKVRMECVAGSEHVPTIVDTVLKHATERRLVFVMPVEEIHGTETVKLDSPVAAATD